jgi:CheY-like chemotaxis protein
VKLMGGTIGLQSEPGVGTAVRVAIPQRKVAGRPAVSSRVAEGPAPIAKKSLRVLLVEDEPVNQKVAQTILTRRGHQVSLANNGKEALALLSRQEFDLILMDVQMPGMDGYEATRLIRGQPRWTRIPILAMTANAFSEDRQQCLDAGMNGYLTKPIDLNEFVRTVENLASGS